MIDINSIPTNSIEALENFILEQESIQKTAKENLERYEKHAKKGEAILAARNRTVHNKPRCIELLEKLNSYINNALLELFWLEKDKPQLPAFLKLYIPAEIENYNFHVKQAVKWGAGKDGINKQRLNALNITLPIHNQLPEHIKKNNVSEVTALLHELKQDIDNIPQLSNTSTSLKDQLFALLSAFNMLADLYISFFVDPNSLAASEAVTQKNLALTRKYITQCTDELNDATEYLNIAYERRNAYRDNENAQRLLEARYASYNQDVDPRLLTKSIIITSPTRLTRRQQLNRDLIDLTLPSDVAQAVHSLMVNDLWKTFIPTANSSEEPDLIRDTRHTLAAYERLCTKSDEDKTKSQIQYKPPKL